MAMVGNLKDFSLSDLLHLLGRGGKSGRLVIWSPNGLYSIWLYQGRVVSAVPPDERYHLQPLLNTLKESTLVSERLMGKLSTLCCEVNEPIGICLKRQDLVSPIVLAQLFRQQLQVGVYSLFVLGDSQFSFTTDAPLPYGEMTGLSKSATEVALEGLRWLSESDRHQQKLPAPGDRFFKLSEGLPMLQLSATEWSVWEQITPFKTVREISLFLEEELLQVSQICSRFLRMGLIELSQELEPSKTSKVPGSRTGKSGSDELLKLQPPKERPNASLLSRLATVLKGIRS